MIDDWSLIGQYHYLIAFFFLQTPAAVEKLKSILKSETDVSLLCKVTVKGHTSWGLPIFGVKYSEISGRNVMFEHLQEEITLLCG